MCPEKYGSSAVFDVSVASTAGVNCCAILARTASMVGNDLVSRPSARFALVRPTASSLLSINISLP